MSIYILRILSIYLINGNLVTYWPKPDKPVVAKRRSRFIGELKIEDFWNFDMAAKRHKKHKIKYSELLISMDKNE